jgi:hypothetical protein
MSKQPTDKEIYLRMRREEEAIWNSKTGDIISQAFDKIYFTHNSTIEIKRITLKTQLGCSSQTIMTWEHFDGYGRCTYINKNAREELQKLRSDQNSYKIAYVINDEDEQELIFEPDPS